VNIPPVECGEPKGIRVVQQSTQCGQTVFDRRHDPRGRLYFWLTGEVGQIQDKNETDAAAIDECYIAVTPLKYDLTDHSQIKKLKGLLEE
jgi:5'-nucleotidase